MGGTNVYYISGQTNAAGNIVPIWTLIGILYGGYILGQSDIVFFFPFFVRFLQLLYLYNASPEREKMARLISRGQNGKPTGAF